MMRQKLYYSKSESFTNLYTSGKQWMLPDGTEYVGLYHRYTTGEIFTEPEWNKDKSRQLVPYKEISKSKQVYDSLNDININNSRLTEYFVKITPQDLKNKFINRYFLKKINSKNIIEVSEEQFKNWKIGKIDNNLYTGVSIKWHISGDVSQVIQDNDRELKQAIKKLPDLKSQLMDLLQFYADTSIVIPRDINGLDS